MSQGLPLTLYFLPRSQIFWLFHLCYAFLYLIRHLALFIYSDNNLAEYFLVERVFQFSLLTFVLLCFRWFYKVKQWHRYSIGKQAWLTLLCACLMANIVMVLLSIVMYPFFYLEVLNTELIKIYDMAFVDQTNSEYRHEFNINLIGAEREAYGHFMPFGLYSFLKVISITCGCLFWCLPYIGICISRSRKKTELDNLRLQNSLKEARLLSLSAQLNPHFLFNSLNNIRFMIHENQQKADDVIVSLSEILRYSLVQGKQEKVLLNKELVLVQQYIDIVSLQLEGRLNFQLKNTLEGQNVFIPPMILQLLIENAIKHGIDNIKHTSLLSLDIFQQKERVVFQLVNPIAKRNSKESAISDTKATEKSAGTGTGLVNIRQRLSLLYDERAELRTKVINEHNQYYFYATLLLPFESDIERNVE